MGRVAGVIGDPPGFPYTPPGVDILEGGKLTSNNVAGSSHNPLQSFAVASDAVSKPGGDAAGQDALHSAGVIWIVYIDLHEANALTHISGWTFSF